MHLALRLDSTAGERPARSATSVAGTPAVSHVDTPACRGSYGRLASGEVTCCGRKRKREIWANRRAILEIEDFTPGAAERSMIDDPTCLTMWHCNRREATS